LIGANEVGKSTLLDALELGYPDPNEDEDDPPRVGSLERTRDESVPDNRVIVRLRYRLEASDLAELSLLTTSARLSGVRWLEVQRWANGEVSLTLDPVPTREMRPRHTIAQKLRTLMADENWPSREDTMGTVADPSAVKKLVEALSSERPSLGPTLGVLRELAEFLEDQEAHGALAEELRDLADIESKTHPQVEAVEALRPLVPRFVRFDDDVRALGSEYELADIDDDTPAPLANLARLAGLDLMRLRARIRANETGTVQDILDSANLRDRLRVGCATEARARRRACSLYARQVARCPCGSSRR